MLNVVMLSVANEPFTLSVAMLGVVVMLNIVMLNVAMVNVAMLSVGMLNAVAPFLFTLTKLGSKNMVTQLLVGSLLPDRHLTDATNQLSID